LIGAPESHADSQKRIAAFRQGLAALGWKDGQNVQIEYRWGAGKVELIQQYAGELVTLAPHVILANSTPVIEELRRRTQSIPIVCALVSDPVGLGLVQSLSRPGGNITGFTFINPEIIGKWMGILREVTPGFVQAALMYNPKLTPFYRNFLRDIEPSRQATASAFSEALVGTVDEIEAAINALGEKPGSGLIVPPDPFTTAHLERIAELARQKRLPAISVHRQFAVAGGLMAYGPDTLDIFRRSAGYIDRILKGANPGDLPVQQPDKFEFTINLTAARALGLTVPATLLALADEMIE
jgi:putative ABC transport system substrate-binding protein